LEWLGLDWDKINPLAHSTGEDITPKVGHIMNPDVKHSEDFTEKREHCVNFIQSGNNYRDFPGFLPLKLGEFRPQIGGFLRFFWVRGKHLMGLILTFLVKWEGGSTHSLGGH
jgi:hypothetical protein